MNGKLAPVLLMFILGALLSGVSYLYVTKADASDVNDRVERTESQVERTATAVGTLLEVTRNLVLNECLKTHTREYCLQLYPMLPPARQNE